VFGGDLDGYNSYAQRGNSRPSRTLRRRHGDDCRGSVAWHCTELGGLIDMSMDGSPIIDHTSIEGLYLKRRLDYGGFKRRLRRLCLAHLIGATSRIRSPRRTA